MGILSDKLRSDRERQEAARTHVGATEALRPTEAEAQTVDSIIKNVSAKFSKVISESGMTEEVRRQLTEQIEKEAQESAVDYETQERLKKIATTNVFGLGPLEPYMAPGSDVTDIIVHRYDHICVEDKTGVHRVSAEFNSEDHLLTVIQRIVQKAGRQINIASPMVDAKLEDGSRVHATIPPVTPDGATLTIRRFNTQPLMAEDYLRLETLTPNMLEFLKRCVIGKCSLIVSGGTGSGKTTLLNMLSSFIPDNELIITIEDNCELQLHQANVRRMEARPSVSDMAEISIQDLVKNSLRMRPDRIVVGEVRDGTVVDMLAAMETGHEGSMSTIHADSPISLVNARIPTLFSQYKGGNFTQEAQNIMIAEGIQLIVQISREIDKTRRITHISVVNGVENGRVKIMDVFRYDRKNKRFYATGFIPEKLVKKVGDRGIVIDKEIFAKGV